MGKGVKFDGSARVLYTVSHCRSFFNSTLCANKKHTGIFLMSHASRVILRRPLAASTIRLTDHGGMTTWSSTVSDSLCFSRLQYSEGVYLRVAMCRR